MAKRPENMSPDERLTRIRSLERKIQRLDCDLMWAQRDEASVRHWAEEAWRQVRHLEKRLTELGDERNQYRMAAGLDPQPRYEMLAQWDRETRRWTPLKITQPVTTAAAVR